jgi:RimJ/RimL family protein N-acetyltransferase
MNQYVFSSVATDRLLLRLLTESDVDAVHRYQSNPDVCRYLPYEPRDRATVAEKLADWSERTTVAAEGDFLQLAIERREDGRLLGDLFFSLRSLQHESAVIGWTLDPEHHGRGYVTEAARAMLGQAFERMAVHRVMAELDVRNTASAAVCKRLGMREEARFVEDYRYKGEWASTSVHALLDREWRAAQPA